MDKGTITISLPNNATEEEIKEIRTQFKEDNKYKHYRLNIIISGPNDFKQNLKDFLKGSLKI